MQGGTCGTENWDGRGLVHCAWPITVGLVAGSEWMPIWLTNADQLRSASPWAWLSITLIPKCPCHMRDLCEKRVLDLVIETRMQQGILGFVKRNYWFNPPPMWFTARHSSGIGRVYMVSQENAPHQTLSQENVSFLNMHSSKTDGDWNCHTKMCEKRQIKLNAS